MRVRAAEQADPRGDGDTAADQTADEESPPADDTVFRMLLDVHVRLTRLFGECDANNPEADCARTPERRCSNVSSGFFGEMAAKQTIPVGPGSNSGADHLVADRSVR
ncbi:hypothetical protein [Saccharothrix australiensis]|uniref:hypothetical protein n=1 Tax=Saccharothrix australiensis TaxID=2072 RepID=UPI001476EFCF|nr:hypothetical protein [Saccharothrix australiensis]